MSPRGSERAWKGAFFVALLAATWGLLAPRAPTAGVSFPLADKLQHVAVFAVLALLAARAYRDRPRWGIAAALVFFGAGVEIAQMRAGRTFEALDIVANAIGALAVFLARRRAR